MGKYDGFTSVEFARAPKSHFDLSHKKRLSCAQGQIVPVLITETIPGDVFSGSTEMLVRLAPLLAPIFDSVMVYVHFFKVPWRIIWEDYEDFFTGGRLGTGEGLDPETAPVPPFVDLGATLTTYGPEAMGVGRLSDFMGVPVLPIIGSVEADYDGIPLDIGPFLAYQRCWYDWYRDRNFVADDVFDFPYTSGDHTADPNIDDLISIKTRDYLKDYFTSALLTPQRGPEVLIPVDASVTYLDQSLIKNSVSGAPITNAVTFHSQAGTGGFAVESGIDPDMEARLENIASISNTTTTIEDFRAAYALQVWYERNAVAGSLYNESAKAHFGVTVPDYRLNRSEYLGGGRIMVRIGEVVTTAFSNDGTSTVPAGNMAGHGRVYGNTNQFRHYCVEHGFILGLMTIMPERSYHQGMPRMFYKRRSFLDYPWPTFAKLGEQVIDKAELFASASNLTEDPESGELPLFGYQSRYSDWKYIPNTNHGDFHDTLLFWTYTSDFITSPELSSEFLRVDVNMDRMFAVPGANGRNYWLYIQNKLSVKRCLPYFGTPNTMNFI